MHRNRRASTVCLPVLNSSNITKKHLRNLRKGKLAYDNNIEETKRPLGAKLKLRIAWCLHFCKLPVLEKNMHSSSQFKQVQRESH